MSYGNKKRLKNAKIIKLISKTRRKTQSYKIIAANRKRRVSLTMKWESMIEMVETFKDKMHFWIKNEDLILHLLYVLTF